MSAATEPIVDINVAVRRWTAAVLAQALEQRGQLEALRDTTDLKGLAVPLEQWSEDARIAARALVREQLELVRQPNEVPGFRGPDIWYRV